MTKSRYAAAMETLYVACIAVSGASLVVITLIIPYGVFMRYVVNAPASWPEPAAVLLMIVFSFVGGAAVYRANVHIAVRALVDAAGAGPRALLLRLVNGAMALTALFMLLWGLQLVRTTWHQVIAEFPVLSVGVTYLPLPLGGLLTLLFIVERVWVGEPPPTSVMYRDQAGALE
ncbi:MAG TPA: TRAP transporter small permease subunit [Methylomirabilota bacterium]|nr:TRAP transporter small permease subunit [Methylomirabilota bacterium]